MEDHHDLRLRDDLVDHAQLFAAIAPQAFQRFEERRADDRIELDALQAASSIAATDFLNTLRSRWRRKPDSSNPLLEVRRERRKDHANTEIALRRTSAKAAGSGDWLGVLEEYRTAVLAAA